MANFIGLVYATLKNEGVDTSGMSTDEAIEKFKELQKKSGGESGENGATPAEQRKLELNGIVDKEVETYDLSESDTTIIDDAIYLVKRNGDNLTVDNVIKQINEDMDGFLPDKKEPKYNAILDYIKERGGNEDKSKNDTQINTENKIEYTPKEQNKIDYLKDKINNSWYKNAKLDYGVNGKVKDISINNDKMTIIVDEDGKEMKSTINYVSDYSPEQLYNIWQEFPED